MKRVIPVAIAVVAVAIAVVLFLSRDRGPRAIEANVSSSQKAPSRSLAGGKPASSPIEQYAGTIQFTQPGIQRSSGIERILALSSPEVRSLFDQGFERLDEGYFLASRQSFRETLLFKDENSIPLAKWAVALTYYREGGTENLMRAADKFGNYYRLYGTRLDLDEFAQAAAINIGVITIELSSSHLDGDLKHTMAGAAIKLMSNYLARWPQGPQAQAVRVAIVNLQRVLDGQR